MNRKPERIDPGHQEKRAFLRTIGLTILIIGVVLLIIGMVDFFTIRNPFEGPKLFWMFFIALPLLFVGGSMTSAGYMGAAARYSAQEMAPVAKDTFNYMADATKEGVETVTRAVRSGLGQGNDAESMVCPSCGKNNPLGASFCNGCGSVLPVKKTCPKCGFDNPPDASFCNSCGTRLG